MVKRNKCFVTLVVGLPGSGKTYYVKEHLGNGVVYDLDYIAAAFRMREPHEERHDAARMLANDLLEVFAEKARRQARSVYIIRTAPSTSEIAVIRPDIIVICKGKYNTTGRADYVQINREEYLRRIQETRNEAKRNSIPLEEV